ncbi:unnamed protein product [Caenorhabditis auriculariae]|uniref:Metalloendopeptidase n=1 Tax=Caenorhabditis auriculariae TaxID=2777116 RepID=A0A8S1HCC7_9PELO|nr:unnamed protein product [Caenorhabditis auriculariae]
MNESFRSNVQTSKGICKRTRSHILFSPQELLVFRVPERKAKKAVRPSKKAPPSGLQGVAQHQHNTEQRTQRRETAGGDSPQPSVMRSSPHGTRGPHSLLLTQLLVQLLARLAVAQPSNLFGSIAAFIPEHLRIKPHHEWQNSGKFQGDIDGIDPKLFARTGQSFQGFVLFNALKNKQLTWSGGVIPYEMDPAFSAAEVKIMEKAFNSYRKNTCIRFEKRNDETDYLNIVKGYGCYSQVGRTGGKQEISLGRGCLFHEIIVHELMHSVGFWHEHSRADRDDHITIKWDNILPGMKSQFDKISAVLQDLQGERYDYRSIMHYDSTAFSRNGKNTIETVEDGFTQVIGSATDLSPLDIVKINKLYQCKPKKKEKGTRITTSTASTASVSTTSSTEKCVDHFVDCPHFAQYCKRASFFFVMKSYCPFTCQHCVVKNSEQAQKADVFNDDDQ